jgi:putative ABC transport system permease protein
MNDLKFAFRQFFKNPSFTAVSVLTLALGIGATTAIFSVVYGVIISPYPYAKPGEIWMPGLRTAKGDQRMRPYRLAGFQEMEKLSSFESVMATRPGSMLLGGEYAPETVRTIEVTANAFQFLGVHPLLGRTLQPSDVRSNGEPEPVAVLSYGRWKKLFGSDTNILGKTLRLDDQPYTILGVMPPRFGWWTDNGAWVPMSGDSRLQGGVFPLARLKAGVSAAAAQQQLHAMQLTLAKEDARSFPQEEFVTTLSNYLDMTVASGTMQRSLRLLFVAVGFLLLIACANVANLQLARATSRTREMAVRLSIGAARGRLIRQLLTESILVSVLGGLLGMIFTYWITSAMVSLMPANMVPNEARIQVNGYVLFFCAAVSVLTGILFGLAPALQLSRPQIVDSLKDEARDSGSSIGRRTRSVLVVAEVALAMVLLTSAGLTVRSFLALKKAELGFVPENVLNLDFTLPPKKYATWERRNRFALELLDRAKQLPGVVAATTGFGGLPFGAPELAFSLEGQTDVQDRRINVQAVGSEYLSTLRVPLRRGRMLTSQDIERSEQFAVINETAAKLWPQGQDPIGRRIRLNDLQKPPPQVFTPTNFSPLFTVVGVIADMRNDDLQSRPRPAVLVPFTLLAPPQRTLTVRAHSSTTALINPLRAAVHALDPELPINDPRSFDEIVNFEEAHPRFLSLLFAFFGIMGLTLAMAGIYSVLSYSVSKRTREIGVRIAIGAQRGDVFKLILRNGAGLVGLGILLGFAASLAATRLLSTQIELFQIKSTDPISLLAVIGLLSVVAAVACFVPARRAAKVDPMEALRYE